MPVPEYFVHIILGPYSQKFLLIALRLFPLVLALVLLAQTLPVEVLHLPTHALEVLLDADPGEALGVLRAGFLKHLALDVDVVGPVLGLQENGLGEARPDCPYREGHQCCQQQKSPAASLSSGGHHRHVAESLAKLRAEQTTSA